MTDTDKDPNHSSDFTPIRWKRRFPKNIDPYLRWTAIGIFFTVFLITFMALTAAQVIRLPYFAVAPGSVFPVNNSLLISESDQYPRYPNSEGNFAFVTARVTGQLTPLEWIDSKFTRGASIIGIKTLGDDAPLPGTPQRRAIGQIQILNSQATAVVVAFRLLNIPIVITREVHITSVLECADAHNKILPKDIITHADGQSVFIFDDLTDILENKAAGDTLALTLLRNGENTDKSDDEIINTDVILGAKNDSCLLPLFSDGNLDDPKFLNNDSASIGVTLRQDIEHNPAVTVKFDIHSIGGPSAGLAFTLGVLDALEPGDLTGGKRIAATGTISADGSINPIGGIKEKRIAVIDNNYDIFFVPKSQLDLVSSKNSSLEVIGVDNIQDVLDALIARGGDPLDPAPN